MYNSNIIIIKSDIFKQIKLVVPNYYLCKMKPTVISNANSSASGSGNIQNEENGVNIQQQQTQFNPQSQHFLPDEPQSTSYGSPGSLGRGQRQQQTYAQQQQGNPSQFRQDFDFQPDVDMFPRTRLGRMTHDPFGDFGGTTRKRTSLHDPQFQTDGFSRYFDHATDFGFPQFNSMGRRRVTPHNDDDFFNRLPSEFRQYMPESFAHRRAGSGTTGSLGSNPATVHMQQPTPQPKSHFCNTMPQSSPIKVCDAAIQTEDPNGRSEVDHFINTENIYPHGLRNTVDMGVKSVSENENQNPRSSSAPPTEQQNLEKIIYIQPQQITVNGPNRLPPQHYQFNTQTSPQILSGGYGGQAPQFQTTLTTPHQTHLQQQQQNSPPQTPGGSYIRTIPIFVEGRTEPIINNNEIPNQNAFAGSQESRAHTPPKQQTQRPSPLNTQQTTPQISGIFPQTPHTVDTINKIQDIQRDVLDLMSRVEKFTDTRDNKEYAYLDEMLTRNLLKLDNIDTNGKDSIRLARKEAIKCIQASINVLEAKAEENKKITQVNSDSSEVPVEKVTLKNVPSQKPATETQKSISADKMTKEATSHPADKPIEGSADNKVMEPIPLPPPESEKFNEVKIEDCPDDDVSAPCINEQSLPKIEDKLRNSPEEK